MAIGSEQWMLFGFDVRDTGRLWLAAWRDFLWGSDSPVRKRLDDVVVVETETGRENYQAGERVAAVGADHVAVALPEELVLERRLILPDSARASLDSVLRLEVSASSPFTEHDTAYGWSSSTDDEGNLVVDVAIVARSAAMSYLAREYKIHDPLAREVWASGNGNWILVRGFGEAHRENGYRRRLVRISLLIAGIAALVLIAALVSLGFRRIELGQLEALASTAQRDAGPALELRDRLSAVNGAVAEINRLAIAYPSPHLELARLTSLLGDDTYIEQFQMSGLRIRLRGRAADAAAVMQLLTEHPGYASVTAPQPITRVSRTNLELFHLEIVLRSPDGLEDRA